MTEQGALFAEPSPGARAVGPVEEATRRSLNAAQLATVDEGAGQALLVAARALDRADASGKPYAVAHTLPPWLDLARALGLTPDGRKQEGGDGGLDEWLRGITSPAMGDPAQP